MLRLRLACLALASGMLVTMSGCGTFGSGCGDGGMFPRLFRSNRYPATMHDGGGPECECQRSFMPQTFDMPPGQGPFLAPPPAPISGPIPITNLPGNMPPIVTKVPNAPPTPYTP